jgi:alkylation response protein AidB-like acyl-CoA dehydrogenase
LAPQIEREQGLPVALLDALHQAQMFRMLLPASCRGAEIDPLGFLEAIEELAKADASTAWCVAQASGCSTAAAYLEPEVARKIFGNERAVMASGPNLGKAHVVDGGYRLTGTWMFASGIGNAGWVGGHCYITEPDGGTRCGLSGAPVQYTLMFPKGDATVTADWDVVGLRGTGSFRYDVQDLFVPAPHGFTRVGSADLRENGPLYRFTVYQIFAIGFAAVALGIARATLDAFVELASHKTPKAIAQTLRENAVVQSQVALAKAKLQSSRAFLVATVRDLWKAATDGKSFSLEQRAELRLATTYAIHQSREVVDIAYHAAGATAIFASNPFERRFRDVNTVSQQVQGHLSNYEPVGQVLLGLPPRSKYL